MNVLLIDDDQDIADVVTLSFEMRWPDARVSVSSSGESGLSRLENENPQVIILDVGLPGMDGFEVLKAIRAISDVPVIMLTVRGSDEDVAGALDMGADDFVIKPFSPLVLLSRVQAVLRRSLQPRKHIANRGEIVMAPQARRVTIGGERVDLSPMEFDLLFELMNHRGNMVKPEDLLSIVWGPRFVWAKDSLDLQIDRLRQKLGDNRANPRIITGGRDGGYTFMEPN